VTGNTLILHKTLLTLYTSWCIHQHSTLTVYILVYTHTVHSFCTPHWTHLNTWQPYR